MRQRLDAITVSNSSPPFLQCEAPLLSFRATKQSGELFFPFLFRSRSFSLFSLIMQKEAHEEDKLVLHYHDVVIRQAVSCNHLEV